MASTIKSDEIIAIASCKVDGEVDSQRLTNISNRGGLWNVSEEVVQIFCTVEKMFKLVYGGDHFDKIESRQMVLKLMQNPVITSHFDVLRSDSEYVVNDELSNNLLEQLLLLYVRVRSFSYAKDMVQKHKIENKKTKQRS